KIGFHSDQKRRRIFFITLSPFAVLRASLLAWLDVHLLRLMRSSCPTLVLLTFCWLMLQPSDPVTSNEPYNPLQRQGLNPGPVPLRGAILQYSHSDHCHL